ncbi:NVEALA domain-containing protein [Proteiniphilum sp. X52]|uniref:NVEALA domain-containing protein n=1 Tax=Proteiniphilum sp. X52 TaxID=2382159 RepID=UPI000F0A82BD|nr:NVEALA domain-containing protein [Proteiniphilum sp. X52]RNC63497.1 hypothetical protein D7D25_16330 [Proteiniphilum sp. X52]
MKKRVLSGLFALALLATAGFGVHKSMKSDVNLSDLALTNVEALANGEYPGIGEPGKDYKYVMLFEVSTERRCIDGYFYVITYYGSDCYFEGNVPCPGPHYTVTLTGYCV